MVKKSNFKKEVQVGEIWHTCTLEPVCLASSATEAHKKVNIPFPMLQLAFENPNQEVLVGWWDKENLCYLSLEKVAEIAEEIDINRFGDSVFAKPGSEPNDPFSTYEPAYVLVG